jgi:hypothetical protein
MSHAASEPGPVYTGGCLCGAIRYEARGEPRFAGCCFCADCQKASGSAFVPFMGFAASALTFAGAPRQFVTRSFRGGEAVRNFCPSCGALVFGGVVGVDDSHTIYAGSLDDPTRFAPRMVIFGRNRPPWIDLPPDVTVFDTMPPG